MGARWVAALFLLLLTRASGQVNTLAPGQLLIAGRDLADPNFAQAVVLLVNFDDEEGALGLVINRPSESPLARVLRDLKEAKGRTDPVYLGGPVESSAVLAVLRSPSRPEDARRVFGDVYLVSSPALLKKTLADGVEPNRFRVYLGYAGWGPGQLEHEVELGAWRILPAEAAIVFDSDPDSVWTRLIRKTDVRIASIPLRTPASAADGGQ